MANSGNTIYGVSVIIWWKYAPPGLDELISSIIWSTSSLLTETGQRNGQQVFYISLIQKWTLIPWNRKVLIFSNLFSLPVLEGVEITTSSDVSYTRLIATISGANVCEIWRLDQLLSSTHFIPVYLPSVLCVRPRVSRGRAEAGGTHQVPLGIAPWMGVSWRRADGKMWPWQLTGWEWMNTKVTKNSLGSCSALIRPHITWAVRLLGAQKRGTVWIIDDVVWYKVLQTSGCYFLAKCLEKSVLPFSIN